MKHKIIIDLSPLRHGYCGLWEYAYQFGTHLIQQFDSDEFDLHFLVPRNHPFGKHENVKFVYTSFIKRHFKDWINEYDLFHDISFPSPYAPSKKFKGKLISTLHDLNFLYEKSNIKIKKYLAAFQRALIKVDYMVFISKFAANDAKQHLSINMPSVVIYNGVTQVKEQVHAKMEYPFFFTLSTFMRKKNIHSLIPMMQFIPNYKLIIAGKVIHQTYWDETKKLVEELGLIDRIVFLGEISEKQKSELYTSCTAFMFPSLAEGFGIPPIEAMSFGKPVFVSDKTSIPEICGDLAFYWHSFNPTEMTKVVLDGLAAYNADKDYRRKLELYASQYNWNDNVANHIGLYKKLLKTI